MGQETTKVGVTTKKCPKCKEEIPKAATKCSHCGSDLRNWFARHKIISVILMLIALGIIASAGMGPSSTDGSTSTSGQQKNAEAQKVYAINEDVRVGDVRWKVLAVKDRGTTLKKSESRFAAFATPKTTTGKFVQVRFEVENLGSDLKSVTDLSMVDEQGRSYIASTDTFEWVPEAESLMLLSNLNPNVPQTFTAIYEVASDASGLKLKVGDLDIWKNDEALINLGL